MRYAAHAINTYIDMFLDLELVHFPSSDLTDETAVPPPFEDHNSLVSGRPQISKSDRKRKSSPTKEESKKNKMKKLNSKKL